MRFCVRIGVVVVHFFVPELAGLWGRFFFKNLKNGGIALGMTIPPSLSLMTRLRGTNPPMFDG
jgi:hypothetical protein